MTDVVTECVDGVGVLTLNRPHRRNALSDPMIEGIEQALTEWRDDTSVGAVVITGVGGAFCAGGDVAEFATRGGLNNGRTDPDPNSLSWLQTAQRRTIAALDRLGKPTVAGVDGAAAGAGLGLSLACDLRVATPRSVFVAAFLGVGLSGDFGVAWFLPRIIGEGRARQMLLAGDKIDGEQALDWGLVNWLVSSDDLRHSSIAVASRLAGGPRFALSQTKRNLQFAMTSTLEDSLDFDAITQIASAAHDDHRRGIQAFVDKVPPVFGQ